MRYKLQSILFLLGALVVALTANYFVNTLNKTRVDQHLDSKVKDTCKKDEANCTKLPIVSINTYGQTMPGLDGSENTIKVKISFYDNQKVSNRLTDKVTSTEKAEIRYRGNSSLKFDKHQYLIKFIDKKNNEKKVSVLGMTEDNKWMLNGPYLDKTLIRNYLAYNITGKIMDATPEVRYCEVYLDGKYQGLYLMIQSISRSLTKVTKYKPKWSNGMSSYIIRMDRTDSENINLNNLGKYTNKVILGNSINIVYPSNKDITPKIKKYIEEDFSKFEKALYSYDYKEYSKYIDVDSFVDYMIVNEYFKNSDAGTHSTDLYKDVRGKIHMGPVWDFNNMADNYVEVRYSHKGFLFQDKTWYEMLLKDPNFTNKVIARYKELRKTYLSDKYIQSYIDGTVKYLGTEINKNFTVWGYSFTARDNMLVPYSRNYTNYNAALRQLKTYLKNRGQWLDENIDSLKQYSHESINKIYEGD
jgi:spore coat protein H